VSEAFFSAYLTEARKQLAEAVSVNSRFERRPLPWTSSWPRGKQLKYISDDLMSPVFQRYGLRELA